jgi:hypothetical protein
MKEFLFVYRTEYNRMAQPSPEEMQASMKRWMDWLGNIAAQDKLVTRGNRLIDGQGKVVSAHNVVTDGPYTEIKETLGGYSIVRAASLDEATEMAKGCPILQVGGNVEVREVAVMNVE